MTKQPRNLRLYKLARRLREIAEREAPSIAKAQFLLRNLVRIHRAMCGQRPFQIQRGER